MPYVTGIDPGLTTGIAWGWYEDDRPLSIDAASNFSVDEAIDVIRAGRHTWGRVVFERFVLSGANKFTADLSAKVVEGAVRAIFDEKLIVWQLRADKALISDKWQKDNGYWMTGKRANWTDGRDVNDAIKHILVWLLRNNHRPTIEMINPREKNVV